MGLERRQFLTPPTKDLPETADLFLWQSGQRGGNASADSLIQMWRRKSPSPSQRQHPEGSAQNGGHPATGQSSGKSTRNQRHKSPGAAAAQLARKQCGEFAEGRFRFSGNSSDPLQPEPPRVAAARATNKDGAGVRGNRPLRFAPAAFRRFRRAKAASQQRARPISKRCAHLSSCNEDYLPRSPSVIGLRPPTAPSRREPWLGLPQQPPRMGSQNNP